MQQTRLGLNLRAERTKREFLTRAYRVVPWDALAPLVSPYTCGSHTGPAVCGADDAGYPLHAAVVHAQRPGRGRGTARRAAVSRVRGADAGPRAARRVDDTAVSAPAGQAQAGRSDHGYDQRLAAAQRLGAHRARLGGRCQRGGRWPRLVAW